MPLMVQAALVPTGCREIASRLCPWRPRHVQVYTWDILPGTSANGSSCGASGKRERAIGGLVEALCRTPAGTSGVVRTATVNAIGDISYLYGPTVFEARREATDSVTVVW